MVKYCSGQDLHCVFLSVVYNNLLRFKFISATFHFVQLEIPRPFFHHIYVYV